MKYLCTLMMIMVLIAPSYADRAESAMGELTRLNGLVEGYLRNREFKVAREVAKEASFLATFGQVPKTDNGEERNYGFSTVKANSQQAKEMTKALSFAVNLKSYQENKDDTPHNQAIKAIVELATKINPLNFDQSNKYSPEDNYNLDFEWFNVGITPPRRNEVRKTIFNQTQWIINSGRYIATDGTIVLDRTKLRETKEDIWRNLELLPNAMVTDFIQPSDQPTQIYLKGLKAKSWAKFATPTEIEVWNADSLDAYLALNPEEMKEAVVLDFANAIDVGGGATVGSRAQEEQICYRTILYLKLLQAYYSESKPYARVPGAHIGLDQVPATLINLSAQDGSDSGLYVPPITIFRSNALTPETRAKLEPKATKDISNQYPYPYALHQPIIGPAIIVSAAFELRSKSNKYRQLFWKKDGGERTPQERAAMYQNNKAYRRLMDEYITITKHKIRFQLRAALQNNKTIPILGAFGCGAFFNLPDVMAELYAQVLKEPEFARAFKRIIFANLVNGGRDELNFTEFQKVFPKLPAS